MSNKSKPAKPARKVKVASQAVGFMMFSRAKPHQTDSHQGLWPGGGCWATKAEALRDKEANRWHPVWTIRRVYISLSPITPKRKASK